jgi:branched-chain amino acid transport system permease protein
MAAIASDRGWLRAAGLRLAQVIQDLFFILTMLTLAQLWNLIAGYGGLVSVGQQAFVGIGAYAMFAGVILWGWDPVPAILLGGVAAFLLAIPMAFFAFRLAGGLLSPSAPG